MPEAYIFCPDVLTDAIDKDSKYHLFTLALIYLLNKEWIKVSTIYSKRYLGFVSDYHKSKMISEAVKVMNEGDIGEQELYLFNIILSTLQEEGLDFYQYEDEYSPIFDVAEQIKDSYDVFIVCNNGKATEVQNMADTEYNIIDSETAFLQVLEREEEGKAN